MPIPKSVKIAGADIDEVHGVNVSIYTPVGPRGDYAGRTAAATVKLYRRATNTPTSEMFKNATNEDGRLNIVTGTIVLENSKRKETYTIEMTLSGDGKSKNFKVPEFSNAA